MHNTTLLLKQLYRYFALAPSTVSFFLCVCVLERVYVRSVLGASIPIAAAGVSRFDFSLELLS